MWDKDFFLWIMYVFFSEIGIKNLSKKKLLISFQTQFIWDTIFWSRVKMENMWWALKVKIWTPRCLNTVNSENYRATQYFQRISMPNFGFEAAISNTFFLLKSEKIRKITILLQKEVYPSALYWYDNIILIPM